MKVTTNFIPHRKQRYDTCGDWFNKGTHFTFNISKLPDWRYEALILIHEQIEAFLCAQRGIKEKDVTEFDIESGHPDPGSLKNAPYHKEHQFATKIEKLLAKEMGISWRDYNTKLDLLQYGK